MKTILKWIGGILATLVVLVVLAAILLPIFLNPNNYRQDISDLVHKETGFYLNINGEIGWSVFPWVGLDIKDITVDDTNKQKLASLNNAAVSVKLLPLLSKKIQISNIKLDGVDIDLVVAKNGTPNWLPAVKPAKAAPAASQPSEASTDSTKYEFSLKDLSVAGVAASGINVSYRDEQSGQAFAIENAQLHTGTFAFGKPFKLTASADIVGQNTALKAPVMKAKIAFTTLMNSSPEQNTYTVDELDLTVTPLGVKNPAKIELKGNLGLKESVLTGKIALAPFDLAAAMGQLNIELPALAGGDAVLRKVSIGTAIEAKENSITLTDMFATVDQNELKGSFSITNLKEMAIRFNLTGNNIVADPYLPVVDSTAANAPGSAATAPASSKSAPAAAGTEPVIIPVKILQTLNIHGDAVLESLTIKGFLFQKPTLAIAAEGGNVRLTKLDAGFYQGKISASAAVNVAGELGTNPQISANAGINGISIPAMAAQIQALKDITGVADANVKVLGHGLTQSQIISGLNGTVDFKVVDGALLGVNLNQILCSMIATVRKEESTRTDWPAETAFTNLSGTARIVNGVIYNNDLTVALATVNVKGDGDVNLIDQNIDYHLGLTITGESIDEQDNACRINKRYANITWPVICKGQLEQPGLCGIDQSRLGQVAAELIGNSLQDKLQQQLQKKLGGDADLDQKLEEGLKGLFNRL